MNDSPTQTLSGITALLSKMKLFRYLSTILLLMISGIAFAARTETAATLMSRCAAAVSGAASLKIGFNLSTSQGTQACSMTVAGSRFVLDSPVLRVWYDGTDQYTYIKRTRELNITEPTADELMECNPFAIVNHYSKVYNVRRLSGDRPVVELTPRSGASNIRKAVLTLDPETMLPTKLIVTLTDGHTIAATVTSVVRGGKVAASTFTYDKSRYPAVEVVDLR